MSCCGNSGKRSIAPRNKHLKPKRNLSALVEAPPLKTIVMCRPTHFGIEYEINPWMSTSIQVDRKKANAQWNELVARIKEYGGKVLNVKPQEDLPDMVFTANAGLYLKDENILVLSKFVHEERQKEQWWFHEFFLSHKIHVVITAHYFEGAGDALFLGDTLIGGHGWRSDPAVYSEIRPLLLKDPVVVKLVSPHFYHLDTCFCPLNDMDYLIYPGAFDNESLESIRSLGGRELAVPENEAKRFACNAVQIGNTVILPSGCPQTQDLLSQAGYNAVSVEMTEFLKSGGACKCLTLAI